MVGFGRLSRFGIRNRRDGAPEGKALPPPYHLGVSGLKNKPVRGLLRRLEDLMGLLSRVSRLFGAPASSASARPGSATERSSAMPTASQTVEMKSREPQVASAVATNDDAPIPLSDDPSIAEVKIDSEPTLQSQLAAESKAATPVATPIGSPRNKQELIEELSRNYKEVVQLVRKVSDHLDREDEREQRVAELSLKVDSIGNVLAAMPEQINSHAGHLNEQIVRAIDRSAEAEREALSQVIEQAHRSGETQAKLVTTMAEFRETMSDVSRSGTRSNEILAEMNVNTTATREEITQLIILSKRWTTIAMVASLGVAIVALVVAVIAVMSTG